jgi:hypothetical protein
VACGEEGGEEREGGQATGFAYRAMPMSWLIGYDAGLS